MNYRNIALGVLLSGVVLAAPVFAGVTDTGDNGQIVRKTTTNYFTTVKANANCDVNTYFIDGYDEDGNAYGHYEYVNHTMAPKTSEELAGNISDTIVQQQISAYQSDIRNWIEAFRGSASGVLECTVGPGRISSYYYDAHDEITAGGEVILVGDMEDLDHAYAAQGKVTVDTILNKHQTYQINGHGRVSPIILDLDGNGKVSASNGQYLPHGNTFNADGAVMFDFYGNGFPVATEWVGEGDGLLCRVPEGKMNGTHLFGTANGYANGFDEMASLDADNNGALEGAELEGLYVWQDKNHNGLADQGELSTLAELGVTSIGVNHKELVGSFVRNGQTFKSFDWWPSVKDARRIKVANR
ncbi:hypothetical protein IJT93_11140 [bacterium]|nr:hypothetical protein [bacterium]